jgi:hypothetical protein
VMSGLNPTSTSLYTCWTQWRTESKMQEQKLTLFLFITWYIWRARNDCRFQRKHWTHQQILNAASSHMSTYLADTETTDHNTPQPPPPPY